MAPEVPKRTSVSCRFCAFSCRVAKSTLASASSSVTEMSDIADADTGRKHGHPLAFVGTRHGIEFTVGNAALLRIEKGSYHGYTAGIPHENYDVGKLLRA